MDFTQNSSLPNPLITSVEKLSTAPIEAKSILVEKVPNLIEKINKLLDLRIRNEVRVLNLIDDGLIFINKDGEEKISDMALVMHKASKDSISELVKIRELLNGLPTERVSVEDEGNQFSMERLTHMSMPPSGGLS